MKTLCLAKTFVIIAFMAFMAGCGGGETTSSVDTPAPGGTVDGPTFTAQLVWTSPTLNEDSSSLTDLAGYKVYYGTSSGVYTNSIDVGAATECVIADLDNSVNYYFSVTAYDTSGNESVFSEESVL